MNTLSLPYNTNKDSKDILLKYIKNQNNIVRFIYNRLQENKDITRIWRQPEQENLIMKIVKKLCGNHEL